MKHKLKKTLFISFIILLILNLALTIYEHLTGFKFYFYGITSSFLHLFLNGITAILAIATVYSFFKRVWNKILLTILLLAGCFYMSINPFFDILVGTYYTIASNKPGQSIVVKESPEKPGPGCAVLQSENWFFIRQIDSVSYEGSITPCQNRLYTVDWQDGQVTVTMPVSEYDSSKTETITVDFD